MQADRTGAEVFVRVSAIGVTLLLILALLAWIGNITELVLRRPVATLLVYALFLFVDLITIAAGITAAALNRSLTLALIPAVAIAITFVMLLLGFDAWRAIQV